MPETALDIAGRSPEPTAKAPTWIIPIILAMISMAVSSYAAYTSSDKASEKRITAVEVQQTNDTKQLDRIDAKLEKIDGKLGQILVALANKKDR